MWLILIIQQQASERTSEHAAYWPLVLFHYCVPFNISLPHATSHCMTIRDLTCTLLYPTHHLIDISWISTIPWDWNESQRDRGAERRLRNEQNKILRRMNPMQPCKYTTKWNEWDERAVRLRVHISHWIFFLYFESEPFQPVRSSTTWLFLCLSFP